MQWLNAIVIGVMSGAAYALVGVTITLMYKSTGVLSFAHAAFAMVAAYVYSDLSTNSGTSPWLAAIAGVAAAAALGLMVERLVMRPLTRSASTSRLIATVAVLGATSAAMILIYGSLPQRAPRLLPEGGIDLAAGVRVDYQQFAVFVVAGLAALLLAYFLNRSRYGVAVRAAADDADAARLVGIPPSSISRLNWIIGAVAAGMAGTLIAPSTIVTPGTFTVLELRALLAVLIGGLGSLAWTFVGGLVIGVVESGVSLAFSTLGGREVAVMLLVVGVLVLRRTWSHIPDVGNAGDGGETFGGSLQTLSPGIRGAGRALASVAAVAVAALGLVLPSLSGFWAFVWGLAVIYALQGLSLVMLSGWGGQVNLMQGALVGLGAYTTLYFTNTREWPLEIAIVLAVVLTTAVGILISAPALRLSGPQFAIVSLAFVSFASVYLFNRPELQGSLPRDTLLGIDITSDAALYYIMLAGAALIFLMVGNLRRSHFGSLLLASRDASQTVRQFGADPARVRLATFVTASAVGGFGGALYGVLFTGFRPSDFGFLLSINLLLYVVVGGLRSLWGPIFAGLVFAVIPQWLQGTSDASSGAQRVALVAALVVVVVIALRPDGLASLVPDRRRRRAHRSKRLVRWADVALVSSTTTNGHGLRDATVPLHVMSDE